MKRNQSPRGFSLLELIIVIALISVMAGIAVPAYQGYIRKADFKTAVRELTSEFFFAKERAISENRHYRLTFTQGSASYTLDQGTSAGGPYNTVQTKDLSGFSQGIGFAGANYSGNAFITFQPRGTCSAGNLQLTNSTLAATITTNNTGRTYVVYTGQ